MQHSLLSPLLGHASPYAHLQQHPHGHGPGVGAVAALVGGPQQYLSPTQDIRQLDPVGPESEGSQYTPSSRQQATHAHSMFGMGDAGLSPLPPLPPAGVSRIHAPPGHEHSMFMPGQGGLLNDGQEFGDVSKQVGMKFVPQTQPSQPLHQPQQQQLQQHGSPVTGGMTQQQMLLYQHQLMLHHQQQQLQHQQQVQQQLQHQQHEQQQQQQQHSQSHPPRSGSKRKSSCGSSMASVSSAGGGGGGGGRGGTVDERFSPPAALKRQRQQSSEGFTSPGAACGVPAGMAAVLSPMSSSAASVGSGGAMAMPLTPQQRLALQEQQQSAYLTPLLSALQARSSASPSVISLPAAASSPSRMRAASAASAPASAGPAAVAAGLGSPPQSASAIALQSQLVEQMRINQQLLAQQSQLLELRREQEFIQHQQRMLMHQQQMERQQNQSQNQLQPQQHQQPEMRSPLLQHHQPTMRSPPASTTQQQHPQAVQQVQPASSPPLDSPPWPLPLTSSGSAEELANLHTHPSPTLLSRRTSSLFDDSPSPSAPAVPPPIVRRFTPSPDSDASVGVGVGVSGVSGVGAGAAMDRPMLLGIPQSPGIGMGMDMGGVSTPSATATGAGTGAVPSVGSGGFLHAPLVASLGQSSPLASPTGISAGPGRIGNLGGPSVVAMGLGPGAGAGGSLAAASVAKIMCGGAGPMSPQANTPLATGPLTPTVALPVIGGGGDTGDPGSSSQSHPTSTPAKRARSKEKHSSSRPSSHRGGSTPRLHKGHSQPSGNGGGAGADHADDTGAPAQAQPAPPQPTDEQKDKANELRADEHENEPMDASVQATSSQVPASGNGGSSSSVHKAHKSTHKTTSPPTPHKSETKAGAAADSADEGDEADEGGNDDNQSKVPAGDDKTPDIVSHTKESPDQDDSDASASGSSEDEEEEGEEGEEEEEEEEEEEDESDSDEEEYRGRGKRKAAPKGKRTAGKANKKPALSRATSSSSTSSAAAGGARNSASAGAHPASSSSKPKAKREKGVSCHQCKTRRVEAADLHHCGMTHAKRPPVPGGRQRRRKKERVCRKKYCTRCLDKFYGEPPPPKQPAGKTAAEGSESCDNGAPLPIWTCPGCRGLCTCAACKRGYSKVSRMGPQDAAIAAAHMKLAQERYKQHVAMQLAHGQGGQAAGAQSKKHSRASSPSKSHAGSRSSSTHASPAQSRASPSVAGFAAFTVPPSSIASSPGRPRPSVGLEVQAPGRLLELPHQQHAYGEGVLLASPVTPQSEAVAFVHKQGQVPHGPGAATPHKSPGGGAGAGKGKAASGGKSKHRAAPASEPSKRRTQAAPSASPSRSSSHRSSPRRAPRSAKTETDSDAPLERHRISTSGSAELDNGADRDVQMEPSPASHPHPPPTGSHAVSDLAQAPAPALSSTNLPGGDDAVAQELLLSPAQPQRRQLQEEAHTAAAAPYDPQPTPHPVHPPPHRSHAHEMSRGDFSPSGARSECSDLADSSVIFSSAVTSPATHYSSMHSHGGGGGPGGAGSHGGAHEHIPLGLTSPPTSFGSIGQRDLHAQREGLASPTVGGGPASGHGWASRRSSRVSTSQYSHSTSKHSSSSGPMNSRRMSLGLGALGVTVHPDEELEEEDGHGHGHGSLASRRMHMGDDGEGGLIYRPELL